MLADSSERPAEPEAGHDEAAAAEHPLRGEIALCLSGGGYRAAGFHLGTLKALETLGLRTKIEVISSLSGGAIFAAHYIRALHEGTRFDEFADSFRTSLLDHNPMAEAIAALPESGDRDHPPSLVRALADAYAAPGFIGPMRLGELESSPGIPADVLFGATEFHSGKAFRFQLSRRSKPVVGNRAPLRIADPLVADLRLADVVAASSCFPAAFEPMIFPNDFHWSSSLSAVRAQLSEELADGVPLMDGGIYDNQGVDGALAVYRRAGAEPGLVLVSDSSARVADLYQVPAHAKRGGWRLKHLRRLGWAFFAGSSASTVALLAKAFSEHQENDFGVLDAALFGLPVAVCMALSFLWLKIDRRIAIEQARVRQQTSVALWPSLAELPLLDFLDLVSARVQSLVDLTSDIFMKRVRGLIQTSLRISDRYRSRVITSQIYDLDGRQRSIYEEQPWLRPSKDLVELARKTEAMPSTIWFNNRAELDELERCGEVTLYFSTLLYLLRHEREALGDASTLEARVFAQAKLRWVALNGGEA